MSRGKDAEFLRYLCPLLRKTRISHGDIRRNFLYTCGIIGLTLFVLLSPLFDSMNEVCPREKISHAKGGSTGCKHHTGVRWNHTGPSSRERPHMLRGLV